MFKFAILFLLFYGLFLITSDWVHQFGSKVDPNTLIWWQQGNIHSEGIELPVMFVAVLIYSLLAYLYDT